MHRDSERPNTPRGQPTSAGPAVEDHGRAVTANIQAAALYRQAQQAADTSDAVTALRQAVTPDPGFALGIADLEALTDTPPGVISRRQVNWERHHIEVVRTAAAGNHSRAADLLREHLAGVGCDPLALRIVTELRRREGNGDGNGDGLDDLRSQIPRCHLASTRPPEGFDPSTSWPPVRAEELSSGRQGCPFTPEMRPDRGRLASPPDSC
jgi:hypothetical protein